jgi:hypothetical protein
MTTLLPVMLTKTITILTRRPGKSWASRWLEAMMLSLLPTSWGSLRLASPCLRIFLRRRKPALPWSRYSAKLRMRTSFYTATSTTGRSGTSPRASPTVHPPASKAVTRSMRSPMLNELGIRSLSLFLIRQTYCCTVKSVPIVCIVF